MPVALFKMNFERAYTRYDALGEVWAITALAIPFIVGNLAWSLVAASNLLLLARLGPDAVAAGALASNLYNALQIFGIGLATAVSPLIARERGRRQHSVRDVRRTVRQGMWVTLAWCVPVWLLLWHARSVLLLIGQDTELTDQAVGLLHGLQWALLPYLWFYVLRHYVGALERPIWGVAITVGALPVNVAISWCLIFGHGGLPALGLFGAGLASSITASLMLAALTIVILWDRRFKRYQLFGRFWVADWPRFRMLIALGCPIAVTFAMEVTVFNAAAFLMGTIGRAPLAAHAIANQVAGLCFMVPLGLSQAATIRIGLAFGRMDMVGIRRTGHAAMMLGIGFAATSALALAIWPDAIIALLLDLHDPATAEVARLARSFIYVAAMFQLVDATQSISAGLLRGMHDTRIPMIIAISSYWIIGMGCATLLALRTPLAGLGIWIGLAIGLTFGAFLLTYRWFKRIMS